MRDRMRGVRSSLIAVGAGRQRGLLPSALVTPAVPRFVALLHHAPAEASTGTPCCVRSSTTSRAATSREGRRQLADCGTRPSWPP